MMTPRYPSQNTIKGTVSREQIVIIVKAGVSDPYSFFTDPDPEVEAGDQYGSGSGSNPDPRL
jgi:hypothetical protein